MRPMARGHRGRVGTQRRGQEGRHRGGDPPQLRPGHVPQLGKVQVQVAVRQAHEVLDVDVLPWRGRETSHGGGMDGKQVAETSPSPSICVCVCVFVRYFLANPKESFLQMVKFV